jgi:glycosyltransferase involved in cell wall biosynthesis
MNVCVLAFAHRTNDGRVMRQARTLADAGHRVAIIGRGRRSWPVRTLIENEITCWELFSKPQSILGRFFQDPLVFVVMISFALFGKWADVYYCHEYQSQIIGWLVARVRKAKMAYDCHEYQPESVALQVGAFLPFLYEFARGCFRKYERMCMRRTDAFVTVNDDLAERLRQDCPLGAVIPNYPTKAEFKDLMPPENWRRRLAGKRVLLFAGYLSEGRGVGMCVRVLSEVRKSEPDACLLLVGGSSRQYRRRIELLAAELNIKDFVYMTGTVSHKAFVSFLPLGHVGLNLIQPEPEKNRWAEPTKCFQYAAAGLPVVSSNLGASAQVVQQMDNGLLVEPSDVRGAADAVMRLLRDESSRIDLGGRGQALFRERMNAEAVSTRLLEVFAHLVKAEL